MWRWVIRLFRCNNRTTHVSTNQIGLLIVLPAIAVLTAISTNGFAAMSASDIAAIQEAISDSSAEWIAGENDITLLTEVERKSLLGSFPRADSMQASRSWLQLEQVAAPAYFSWGNNGGYNWMTSIKNQGGCGSCWSFGVCGAFEVRERIRVNLPSIAIDMSEQNMVSCWAGTCDGWWSSAAIDSLGTVGCPDESCFPYSSGSGGIPSCDSRCTNWFQRLYHVGDHGWWYLPTIQAIKDEIMNHGPVPTFMMVYTDFYSYNGGVYTHVSGDQEGGHTVILYGWDDANNCWLAKNSWGTNWGEAGPDGTRGWFRIRMGVNECMCERQVDYFEPIGRALHVATTGSDPTGDGSVSSPLRTIQYGVNVAHAGDTVAVAAGTYTENVECSKGLYIQGASAQNTIIDAGGIKKCMWIRNAPGSTGEIRGFTFTDSDTGYTDGQSNCGLVIGTQGTGNWHVHHNLFQDNLADGIDTYDRSLIEHNVFYNNGHWGLFVSTSAQATVYNNVFKDNGSAVNTALGVHQNATSVDIQNNIFLINGITNYGCSNYILDYNDVVPPNYYGWSPGVHDIHSDPLFVGGAPFDYHFQCGSPCIDAGNPAFPYDPDGTRADIGAYYYDQISGDPQLPQVTGVSASDGVCGQLQVSWLDVPGETGYRVYRDGNLVRTTSANTVFWNDGTAVCGASYNYTVRAYNDCGDSPLSSGDAGWVNCRPSQVTGVNASDGVCGQVNISWTDVENETSYWVYRNMLPIGGPGANVTSWTDAAAPCGVSRDYTVRASNSCGQSDLHSIKDTGWANCVPVQVFAVGATDDRPDNVVISWWGLPTVNGYRVYRDGSQVGTDLSGDITQFTDIPDVGCHSYAVMAFTYCGDGSLSEPTEGCRVCCAGRVGDANVEGEYPDEVTLGDIMLMVDVKFISGDCGLLQCIPEADVNQDGGANPTCDDHVTLGDIMTLVDFLFITGPENSALPDCL